MGFAEDEEKKRVEWAGRAGDLRSKVGPTLKTRNA